MPYLTVEEFDLAERVHVMIISGAFQAWRKGTPKVIPPKVQPRYESLMVLCAHFGCRKFVVKGERRLCRHHWREAQHE